MYLKFDLSNVCVNVIMVSSGLQTHAEKDKGGGTSELNIFTSSLQCQAVPQRRKTIREGLFERLKTSCSYHSSIKGYEWNSAHNFSV